jgi:hypothetical protein
VVARFSLIEVHGPPGLERFFRDAGLPAPGENFRHRQRRRDPAS